MLCGFRPGQHVVVYDETGAFDTFSVTSVDTAGTLTLRHMQLGELSKAYPPGSKIAEVVQHTYFIDAADMQLMRLPTACRRRTPCSTTSWDSISSTTANPIRRSSGVRTSNRSVTYGPAPPPFDVTQNPWAAGENCMWLTSGGAHVSRLASIGSGELGLVRLTAAQLTDGPWCPDPISANRYDADLLRIRKVRVTIRLQTGNAALRGSLTAGSDALFVNPGTATTPAQTVADQSIRFDISPRNMNLGR